MDIVIIFSIFFGTILSLFYLSRWRRNKIKTLPPLIFSEDKLSNGLNVPVLYIKIFYPWLLFDFWLKLPNPQSNNLWNPYNPAIVFFSEYFRYKNFFWRKRKYSEIKEIDIHPIAAHYEIIVSFKTVSSLLVVCLLLKEDMIELLKFFERKDIILSKKAQARH